MLNQAQELIFERYKHPLFNGTVEGATHQADGANPVCGDEVHIELRIEGDTIKEIRHGGRSCAICTASADLLCEDLVGMSVAQAESLDAHSRTTDLGIPLSPVRVKCAALPLETLKLALRP